MEQIISNNSFLVEVSSFREKMNEHNFIFSYRGQISHKIVKNLLSMAEKKIDNVVEGEPVKRKIFGVMIDCLQTICSPENTIGDSKESIFMIGKKTDAYCIYAGTTIENSNSGILKDNLEQINQSTNDSLSDFRKEKLLDLRKLGTDLKLDEATLGLINIAKKSGKKLDYLIEEIDSSKSFFSVQISLN